MNKAAFISICLFVLLCGCGRNVLLVNVADINYESLSDEGYTVTVLSVGGTELTAKYTTEKNCEFYLPEGDYNVNVNILSCRYFIRDDRNYILDAKYYTEEKEISISTPPLLPFSERKYSVVFFKNVYAGDYDQDITIGPGEYSVVSDIEITAKFTIKPGTTLLIYPNTGISVAGGGQLCASGTSDSKIIFTLPPGNIQGNWSGIGIGENALGAELKYCEFYNANTAIEVIKDDITIEDCGFSDTENHAIRVQGDNTAIRNCSFNNIGNSAIYVQNTSGYSIIEGCAINGAITGLSIYGHYTTVKNCIIEGSYLRGIHSSSSYTGIKFLTNNIINNNSYAVAYGGFLDGNYIAGNNGAGAGVVDVSLGSNVDMIGDGTYDSTSTNDPPQFYRVDGVRNPMSVPNPL